MPMNKKELTELFEKMAPGQEQVYKLAQTFGGNYCVVNFTPDGKKKYVMRWGKSVEVARSSEPFLQADKAKKIAEWIAERHGEAVTAEALKQAV